MAIRSMETNDAPWKLLTLWSKRTSNFVKTTTVEVCSLYLLLLFIIITFILIQEIGFTESLLN